MTHFYKNYFYYLREVIFAGRNFSGRDFPEEIFAEYNFTDFDLIRKIKFREICLFFFSEKRGSKWVKFLSENCSFAIN